MCRKNFSRIDPADFSKTKSVFISVPFCRWDKGREILFKHEFGDPDYQGYPKQSFLRECGGAITLRKKYLEEQKVVVDFKKTTYMQFYKDEEMKAKREAEGQSIPYILGRTSEEVGRSNLLFLQTVIEATKLCLEMRLAPFNNFKKLVDFMVNHKAEDLARIKRWPRHAKYLSNLFVDSYIQTIYQTVCYGMWKESVLHRDKSRRGSRVFYYGRHGHYSKTDQHVAIAMKYISLDAKECSERVLAVRDCKDKTGEGLMDAIKLVTEDFNETIANLRELLSMAV